MEESLRILSNASAQLLQLTSTAKGQHLMVWIKTLLYKTIMVVKIYNRK